MRTKTINVSIGRSTIPVQRWKAYAGGVIIGIIVLFILVNVCCVFAKRLQQQNIGAYKSCAALAKAYQYAEPTPDIVLLGSSAMRMSFFLMDRQHTNYIADYDRYCWSNTFQNIIRTAGLKDSRVFNFAIDDEMVSDALLINERFFRVNKSPKLIIYGITPRDLIDNTLRNYTDTPICSNLSSIWDLCRNYCKNIFSTHYLSPANNKKIVDISGTRANPEAWYLSIEDYCNRYKTFDQRQFRAQCSSLTAFCKDCQQKNIKLLLVNMPLTKEHLNLLPTGAYQAYHQAIIEAGRLAGVSLLDLQNPDKFPDSLYADITRLNENGAHRLSMIIANELLKLNGKPQIIDGPASWWLARAYFAEPKPPEIVVLGSSQLGPVLGADAYTHNRIVDATGDHRSQVLEHDFHIFLDKKWRVLISALPDAMISDQFIISRALFTDKYKPELVALTFSPRDFIDNTHHSLTSTEAFAFFSNYINSNFSPLRDALDKARLAAGNYQAIDDHCSKYTSPMALGKPFELICPGEVTINSGDGYIYVDNIPEYKKRYKNPFPPQLKVQLHYLDDLLAYLTKQHIKVVAFGLPLTAANRQLLPEDFWRLYTEQISSICKKNGADWINVDINGFGDKEFMDGVHLNLHGGFKLTYEIALYAANKFHWKTLAELVNDEKTRL